MKSHTRSPAGASFITVTVTATVIALVTVIVTDSRRVLLLQEYLLNHPSRRGKKKNCPAVKTTILFLRK
jgi:hypothetical protein